MADNPEEAAPGAAAAAAAEPEAAVVPQPTAVYSQHYVNLVWKRCRLAMVRFSKREAEEKQDRGPRFPFKTLKRAREIELESVELMLKRNSSSRLMPGPHAAKAGTLTHVWEPQHHPADGWLNLP